MFRFRASAVRPSSRSLAAGSCPGSAGWQRLSPRPIGEAVTPKTAPISAAAIPAPLRMATASSRTHPGAEGPNRPWTSPRACCTSHASSARAASGPGQPARPAAHLSGEPEQKSRRPGQSRWGDRPRRGNSFPSRPPPSSSSNSSRLKRACRGCRHARRASARRVRGHHRRRTSGGPRRLPRVGRNPGSARAGQRTAGTGPPKRISIRLLAAGLRRRLDFYRTSAPPLPSGLRR